MVEELKAEMRKLENLIGCQGKVDVTSRAFTKELIRALEEKYKKDLKSSIRLRRLEFFHDLIEKARHRQKKSVDIEEKFVLKEKTEKKEEEDEEDEEVKEPVKTGEKFQADGDKTVVKTEEIDEWKDLMTLAKIYYLLEHPNAKGLSWKRRIAKKKSIKKFTDKDLIEWYVSQHFRLKALEEWALSRQEARKLAEKSSFDFEDLLEDEESRELEDMFQLLETQKPRKRKANKLEKALDSKRPFRYTDECTEDWTESYSDDSEESGADELFDQVLDIPLELDMTFDGYNVPVSKEALHEEDMTEIFSKYREIRKYRNPVFEEMDEAEKMEDWYQLLDGVIGKAEKTAPEGKKRKVLAFSFDKDDVTVDPRKEPLHAIVESDESDMDEDKETFYDEDYFINETLDDEEESDSEVGLLMRSGETGSDTQFVAPTRTSLSSAEDHGATSQITEDASSGVASVTEYIEGEDPKRATITKLTEDDDLKHATVTKPMEDDDLRQATVTKPLKDYDLKQATETNTMKDDDRKQATVTKPTDDYHLKHATVTMEEDDPKQAALSTEQDDSLDSQKETIDADDESIQEILSGSEEQDEQTDVEASDEASPAISSFEDTDFSSATTSELTDDTDSSQIQESVVDDSIGQDESAMDDSSEQKGSAKRFPETGGVVDSNRANEKSPDQTTFDTKPTDTSKSLAIKSEPSKDMEPSDSQKDQVVSEDVKETTKSPIAGRADESIVSEESPDKPTSAIKAMKEDDKTSFETQSDPTTSAESSIIEESAAGGTELELLEYSTPETEDAPKDEIFHVDDEPRKIDEAKSTVEESSTGGTELELLEYKSPETEDAPVDKIFHVDDGGHKPREIDEAKSITDESSTGGTELELLDYSPEIEDAPVDEIFHIDDDGITRKIDEAKVLGVEEQAVPRKSNERHSPVSTEVEKSEVHEIKYTKVDEDAAQVTSSVSDSSVMLTAEDLNHPTFEVVKAVPMTRVEISKARKATLIDEIKTMIDEAKDEVAERRLTIARSVGADDDEDETCVHISKSRKATLIDEIKMMIDDAKDEVVERRLSIKSPGAYDDEDENDKK